ncbi:MAG: preprotein translocase subunit YajC [Alistipes sp.]|jgi:preprotein translocase subunit YajC|nr:preprotein translocase subunit YajC [Alistipes sp.]
MMNFLQAAEAAPQQPGMGSFWVMMLLMIVVMYFFMWRPESKRRKEMAKFRDGLKKGDKIITAGGIYGVVKEVKAGEPTILIEVDSNVTLRVDKNMVVADNTQLQK